MKDKALTKVRAQVRTSLGWLEVTFHVPEGRALDDHLTHAPPFVATTDAKLLRTGRTFEFLDLRLAGVSMVAPVDGVAPPAAASSLTDVLVVVNSGTIDGQVALLPGARVSDHFAHRRGFLAVRSATLHPFERVDAVPGTQGPRLLYLNSQHITGVAEGSDG
jgi:hypothetical protein